MTLKTLERKEQPKLKQIASDNVPIYSIKTNTTTQVQAALRDVFNLGSIDNEEIAMREAEEAVYKVMLNSNRDRTLAADVVRSAHAAPSSRNAIACNRAAPASNPTAASESSNSTTPSRHPERGAQPSSS